MISDSGRVFYLISPSSSGNSTSSSSAKSHAARKVDGGISVEGVVGIVEGIYYSVWENYCTCYDYRKRMKGACLGGDKGTVYCKHMVASVVAGVLCGEVGGKVGR